MSSGRSIRARLLLAAALVLLFFLAGVGYALQRAHADSVRAAHFARLQGTVYLLLARAEIDADGSLAMPPEFAEPRLSLPHSGLYAAIHHVPLATDWRSASTLNVRPPFRRDVPVGEWRSEDLRGAGGRYLAVSYGVKWAGARHQVPLVVSVMEDRAGFEREEATFARTLGLWLGGAGVLLLAAQLLLLRWGLAPLERVAGEVRRVESGAQARIEGDYPAELEGLAENLNTLIAQERVRQTRYKEALSFLAHSLKTPLAVLRGATDQPDALRTAVLEQVSRMDDIVQHQLARAAAQGRSRFAPAIALAPVLQRVADALRKVHAARGIRIDAECPPALQWRLDEGDAFELLGNLLDNACKWARSRVVVRLWTEAGVLHLRVEDDGPGFSDTEAVLRLHVRGDERVPGHGVGLAVVKELVDAYQGSLVLGQSALGGAQVEIGLAGA